METPPNPVDRIAELEAMNARLKAALDKALVENLELREAAKKAA